MHRASQNAKVLEVRWLWVSHNIEDSSSQYFMFYEEFGRAAEVVYGLTWRLEGWV